MENVRELYDSCYRRLVAQLYVLCGSLSEAEDAVQEAFVRAIEKPRHFEELENPEAWLRTVALNIARSRFRRAATFHRLMKRTGPPADSIPGLSPDHVALVDALRRLPWEQREVITLHHIVDLPVREVAAQLGVPEGTVKARLARGRTRLGPLVRDFHEEVDHV
ncbi:RNA polymerase sigma factor [Kribbella sp. NPDC020789]